MGINFQHAGRIASLNAKGFSPKVLKNGKIAVLVLDFELKSKPGLPKN